MDLQIQTLNGSTWEDDEGPLDADFQVYVICDVMSLTSEFGREEQMELATWS